MPTYAAFLRGINVGGNKKVPMAQLKTALAKAGFENVRTLLNSGNALLETKAIKEDTLAKKLSQIIEKEFGFPVPVIVRSISDLQKLADAKPFKRITVTKDTRLYITFRGDQSAKQSIKVPYVSPEGNYRILKVTNHAIISVLTVKAGSGTVDAMAILEKEFGKNVTTRNWNTVEKLLSL